MPPDPLRKLVNARDKAMARPHRLEPERLVLPARGNTSTRRVCRNSCGWSVSAWEWDFELPRTLALEGGVLVGKIPSPGECPRCGGEIVLVES
jgi:hypothetical protein